MNKGKNKKEESLVNWRVSILQESNVNKGVVYKISGNFLMGRKKSFAFF